MPTNVPNQSIIDPPLVPEFELSSVSVIPDGMCTLSLPKPHLKKCKSLFRHIYAATGRKCPRLWLVPSQAVLDG